MQLSSLIFALVLSISALAAPLPLSTGSDVVGHGVKYSAHGYHEHGHPKSVGIEAASHDEEFQEQHLVVRGNEKVDKAIAKVKAVLSNTKQAAGSAAGPIYRATNNAVRQAKGKDKIPTAKRMKTRVDNFVD